MLFISLESRIPGNRNTIDQSSNCSFKNTVGQAICCILDYRIRQDNKVTACVHLYFSGKFEGLTTGNLSFKSTMKMFDKKT